MCNKALIAFCFYLIISLMLSAQEPSKTVNFKIRKATNISAPQEPATFLGGDINTFREWVQRNLVYPADAAEAGIGGQVISSFVVDTTGKVRNIKIVKNTHPSIDKEVIMFISNSPVWKAATQYGKPVEQTLYLTLKFQLQ